eukprot:SAG31_NODE_715_length_12634_cov_5.289190_4_plen_122_part_00
MVMATVDGRLVAAVPGWGLDAAPLGGGEAGWGWAAAAAPRWAPVPAAGELVRVCVSVCVCVLRCCCTAANSAISQLLHRKHVYDTAVSTTAVSYQQLGTVSNRFWNQLFRTIYKDEIRYVQ